MTIATFAPGNYRYLPAYFQYSSGVAAEPGYQVERVALHTPLPLTQGFEKAAAILAARGRPLTAFCACELRSPGQFSDAGFRAFNELYCRTLAEWGIYDVASRANPVARSNVCPEVAAPAEPLLYAFCFTAPATGGGGSFVISGAGEARQGDEPYAQRIVRYRDTSADALREKALHVLETMAARQRALGVAWSAVTATQVYTVHDLHPFLADAIVARGAARHGLTWHYARPPVQGLEYEMDCRGVAVERVVA